MTQFFEFDKAAAAGEGYRQRPDASRF